MFFVCDDKSAFKEQFIQKGIYSPSCCSKTIWHFSSSDENLEKKNLSVSLSKEKKLIGSIVVWTQLDFEISSFAFYKKKKVTQVWNNLKVS